MLATFNWVLSYMERERPTFVPSDRSEGESDIGDYRKAKKELKSYSSVNCSCNTTDAWGENNSLVVVQKYLCEEIVTRQGMYV